MSEATNLEITIAEIPQGAIQESNFAAREVAVPTPGEGEILVRTILMSLDAANRAWMQGATYRDAVTGGDPMPTFTLGEVVTSKADGFAPGDIVTGGGFWANYVILKGKETQKVSEARPLSHQISLYGIAGKTAYHGLMQIGVPKEGETVVVSAAGGSVGTLVGQMAKAKGCKVVGIAGGREKCDWLVNELGFDACVDYKADNLFPDLKAACPDGIDIYYDNVGGPILETVLFQMNLFGRIICCGAVSQYDTGEMYSPRGIPGLLVVKRLKMQGFIVMDYAKHDGEFEDDVATWIATGKLRVIEDIVDGLENAPKALIGLLHGENRGKRMVRVAPDPA